MKTNVLERTKTARRKTSGAALPRIGRILAPTDFSNEATAGVRYAMRLARRVGAAAHLVHVVEPFPSSPVLEAVMPLPAPSEMAKQARCRLKKLAETEAGNGVRASTSVLTGKAFHSIITTASEWSADLIVMATHGYTGLAHALLGSTTERVVRHAPCSVLTVPVPRSTAARAAAKHFKIAKLLVPLDFSNLSKIALPRAVSIARSFNAEIVLFNVTEVFPIEHLMGPESVNHLIWPLMEDARTCLEGIAQKLKKQWGVKTSAAVIDGSPHKEICQAAQEMKADLVVLTTHGFTGLKHVWLGSTAERVVRHAHCPVLVVREPKE